jgi:hypothetical protein
MKNTKGLLCKNITQNVNGTSLVHLTSRLDENDNTDGHSDLWFHVQTETCTYVAGECYNVDAVITQCPKDEAAQEAIPSE